jgi:hypothetical protein
VSISADQEGAHDRESGFFASAIQIIAFVGFGIATVAFFVWVAYLVRG